MLIEDGTGSGKTAAVSDENRLKTTSIISSTEHHINHSDGLSFNLIINQTPSYSDPSEASGDVCFAYIKNTSEIDMCLEEVNIRLAGTAQSEVVKVRGKNTGTPTGGTNATPANLNLNSGKQASGTFLVGNELTGLTSGTELDRIYLGSSNDISNFNFGQDIIVPKNNIITFWASTLDAEIYIGLMFNYHTTETG